jgi:hypothetical protein
MIKLQYDIPVEITTKQLEYLRPRFSGVCCFRTELSGQHFMKCWLMKFSKPIEQYLNSSET